MIYNTYVNTKPRPTSTSTARTTSLKASAGKGSAVSVTSFCGSTYTIFYTKSPKKTNLAPALTDKENKAAKNAASRSSVLERLTKPTAATKNSAVEKVVKKEALRAPFATHGSIAATHAL